MSKKKCFKCNGEKELTEYYKHKQMADGHLNKCKLCTRKDTKKRANILSRNPDWVEKERARGREKSKRLGYPEKYKPSTEKKRLIMQRYNKKYPEKKKARTAISHLRRKLKITKGLELHHWSYNSIHFKDVIIVSTEDHNTIHRFLDYDQSEKMYRTKDGRLLDTNLEHWNYVKQFIA